jgi:hypothetical protein
MELQICKQMAVAAVNHGSEFDRKKDICSMKSVCILKLI